MLADKMRALPSSARAFQGTSAASGRLVHTRARLLEEEPVYFNDIYEALMDRLQDNYNPAGTPKPLPRDQSTLLLRSIRSKEHAQKALRVLSSEFESTKELALNDWHVRRKQYITLCSQALKQEAPEVLQQLMEQLDELKAPTYFVKDLIAELGRRKAAYPVLLQLLEALEAQRGAQDPGVAHAYFELLVVCQRRALSQEAKELFGAADSKGVVLSAGLQKYRDSLAQQLDQVAA